MTIMVQLGNKYPITFATNVNVSEATAVEMHVAHEGTGAMLALPAVVSGPTEVTHTLDGTLAAGRYRLWVRVTWADGRVLTFPSPGSEFLEVLAPQLAIPFILPDELRDYTKGLISATDARAPLILAGATQAIQNFCGWHIAPAKEVTVQLDGGGRILYLPSLKVNSLTSVSINGTAIDLSLLEWSRVTGNVRYKSGCWFPETWGGIEVVFNSGYQTVPADLKQIVLQVASAALSSPTGATREQAGQVSMQWATTAPGVAGGLSLLDRDFQIVSQYFIPKEA